MNEIASRYGNALFLLSKEKNLVLDYQEEVKTLIGIIKDQPKFIDVLNSAFLSIESRKQIVDKTLTTCALDIVNLVKIMIDNDRIVYLLDTLYAFNSFANEYRGVDEGFIYSVFSLSQNEINEITNKISKIEGRPIFLKNVIDTNLIGGVKVVINDHVYDGSIKNKLKKLKENLHN